MRFNRQELVTLASQPSQKFDKEGVLFLRERQDGFFRRSERKSQSRVIKPLRKTKSLRDLSCYGGSSKVNLERWCRLRGNLLFYFKSRDQWSEPLGVIVLEQCTVTVDPANIAVEGQYGFYLVFDGGTTQYLGATSDAERSSWLQSIQQASYDCLRLRLHLLQEQLELRRGQDPNLDVDMWRLQRSSFLDPSEVPICEISVSCDNLLCDGNGRPPNPLVSIHVFLPLENIWIKYAETEVVERSSNPSFLNTVCFRQSDGLSSDARVKFSALDVRERVSHTAAPLGQAVITLASIQDSQKLRIPLRSSAGTTVGFLSMIVWNIEVEEPGSTESTPSKVIPPPSNIPMALGHRRSQSLPPRLSAKLKLPHQGPLTQLFANPCVHTYRFHSGLGGDICVQETMVESRLCFTFPQQLLTVWIQEEKELLQEVAGMGELREPWHSRQLELLDRHLQLLHVYSQAKEHLQAQSARFFKPSSRKQERSLEFAPLNLHLQRMWAQNGSLKRCGFFDVITVGAFTAHSHKSKNGGLIKLIQNLKEAPMDGLHTSVSTKTRMASEAVAAIKQLRREVVDGMQVLMRLARDKQTAGMLPICDEMVKKTRTLLSVWDATLVEEALTFVEEYKVIKILDDGLEFSDDSLLPPTMSPYRRLTQQLNLELKSPDVDDLATPDSPNSSRRLWGCSRTDYQNNVSSLKDINGTFPSQHYRNHREQLNVASPPNGEQQIPLFLDCEEEVTNLTQLDANRNHSGTKKDGNDNSSEPLDSKLFLDTQAMCNSPSANYYKPTDEPEPWDLTQLNIEASVMCLVSKVKFLCGRCGSPAVRLRTQRSIDRARGFLENGEDVVTTQPASRWPPDVTANEVIHKAVDSVSRAVNGALIGQTSRNKFTDGLDFNLITDWTCELRPSMRKLRQAMDGLLKTARLTHSAFRVQEDRRIAQRLCNVRYRRDVCFSQALTSLVTGLMTKLWCQKPDPTFLLVLTTLGPIAEFEGLLSYHGDEIDMWGDMSMAIEDLATVRFTFSRHKVGCDLPQPRVYGTRASLTVCLPVPDAVHAMLPLTHVVPVSFYVTPVFFNVGINERATLADTLGTSKPQDKSNIDNFERLHLYYNHYRKICPQNNSRTLPGYSLNDLIEQLRISVHGKQRKNVQILHLAARICRKVKGLRFTSCKSAKDRTGMSVTLEQANVLVSEFDLAEHEFQGALDCMRSQGCRIENTIKNTGVKKYAINSLQILSLPPLYRPPPGTFGSNAT